MKPHPGVYRRPGSNRWQFQLQTPADLRQRQAAPLTFVVTASGLTLWGVGAAFWGAVAGALALAVQRWRA